MIRGTLKPSQWLSLAILPGLVVGCAGATNLNDKEMLDLAKESVTRESPKAVVAPVQSKNPHLGTIQIPCPLPNYHFFCATLGYTPAEPARKYLAVSRTGTVIYPATAESFAKLLASEDKSEWKDEDFLNTAVLWVHLMSVANEDGWKVLKKPEDFTALQFNMAAVGLGVDKQAEAAKQIVAPLVQRKGDQVAVSFYAWHLIGGYLRKWNVKIGPKPKAEKQELGQFGGGGYD